jgi:hypothetical protein
MDEHFTCEACGATSHIRYLRHRHTMPGDYCKTCAAYEQCAACDELEPVDMMEWEENRLMCSGCVNVLMCEGVNVSPITSGTVITRTISITKNKVA